MEILPEKTATDSTDEEPDASEQALNETREEPEENLSSDEKRAR